MTSFVLYLFLGAMKSMDQLINTVGLNFEEKSVFLNRPRQGHTDVGGSLPSAFYFQKSPRPSLGAPAEGKKFFPNEPPEEGAPLAEVPPLVRVAGAPAGG